MAVQSTGAQWVTIGSGASLDNILPRTVVGWFKPLASGGQNNFAGKFASSNGWSCFSDTDGTLSGYQGLTVANFEWKTSSPVIVDTSWLFLAWVFDMLATPQVQIYRGALTSPVVAEAMTMVGNSTGTAHDDSNGDLTLCGLDAFGGIGSEAIMRRPIVVAAALTLAQLETLRRRTARDAALHASGVVYAGEWLTNADLADLSGAGNNGSNTGGCTTVADADFPGPPTRRLRL